MNRLPRPSAAGLLRALREWPGWFTLAAGAALCVLGWYGVSGESLTARQLPYLASATAPGAALIVAGAVLIAARRPPGQGAGADPRLDRLYELLVTEEPPVDGPAGGAPATDRTATDGKAVEPAGTGGPDDRPPLALPGGTLYHRPGCPLVTGKEAAAPLDPPAVRARGLAPCPVCEPAPPAGAEPPAAPGP
ncbi:hypothetical protein [Kitasatospora sp. NPDC057015]|uniref:hypothetical protein n=1 Tax=Kitasatospora sp. NPDC057015 TaxID=3346001 RepID=UPI00363C8D72